MGHYRSNLRDIEFNLFEMLGADRVLGVGPFADLDRPAARAILAELERLASTDLAASYADGDRIPPVFDPDAATVTLAEPIKRSYKAYLAGEWDRLPLPTHLGGCGASPSIQWAAAELVLGANPAVHLYGSGPAFAVVLDALGTPEQRRLARWLIERHWGATMVLTEPDAGSDVGAARARAVPQPDGSWHLTGVKRFITGADWDVPENIVHFVLARPAGAGPGSKGLSLFVVPKFLVDLATGELGGRNGVRVTNLEKKLGLTASATCELTFGADRPAVGWLLGGRHDGIAQMFRIIEHARMMVGTKAMATLSTGYLNALAFARDRVQGADLARAGDPSAPRVPITAHPEVRRTLMLTKAYAEGLRALVLYTARVQDDVALARAAGRPDRAAERRNDLLLPVVKGFGAVRANEQLGQALEVLGGSGYLRDYPLEQYLRDARIDTLYEGTTAIQGLDLFFRKIVRDGGEALGALLGEVRAASAAQPELDAAVTEVAGLVAAMTGFLADPARGRHRAALNATRLLLGLGDLLVGWLLHRQGQVAAAALPAAVARDREFYRGKIAVAEFFAAQRLPLLAAERAIAQRTDGTLLELAVDAF